MRLYPILAATTAALLGACMAHAQTPTQPGPGSIQGELKNASGQVIGQAEAAQGPKGVLIRVEAKGLTPGWHGLHLHAKGDCSKSDFTTAGPHVHGGGAAAVHGLMNPQANEAGDLPNLHVGADGSGAAEIFSILTSVASLKDADGSAIVIHAGPDDQMSQPIGGSGARVACAVLR